MSQNGEGVTVNAFERFRARHDARGFVRGDEEVEIIGATIKSHTAQFTDYLLHASPLAAERLADDLADGFDGTLGDDLLRKSKDCAIDEEALVVYSRDPNHPIPRLIISLALVNHLNRVIEPAFNTMNRLKTAEEQDEAKGIAQTQLKVATAMATWLGLAKWAFDSLDQRANEAWLMDLDFQAALAQDVGLDTTAITIPSDELIQAIDKNMIIARYRFTGAMMYRGAVSELNNQDGPFLGSLAYLKEMRSQIFQEQAETNPQAITGLQFALAQPLSDASVARLLNVLAG